MCYSVEPRDYIFIKGYGILDFAENMYRNSSRNISRNVSSRYIQKLLDHVKQSAIDTLKTASKKQIRKPQKQLMIWLIIKLLIELQKP